MASAACKMLHQQADEAARRPTSKCPENPRSNKRVPVLLRSMKGPSLNSISRYHQSDTDTSCDPDPISINKYRKDRTDQTPTAAGWTGLSAAIHACAQP